MKIVDGPIVDDADTPFSNFDRKTFINPFERFAEVRLRVGVIDNPTKLKEGELIDPLNHSRVINLEKGKFVIKWINNEGGLIRPVSYVDGKRYDASGLTTVDELSQYENDFLSEVNNLDDGEYDILSNREPLGFTHPVMWANDTNWMGLHYLPPVGSIVVVGFMANNKPVMLGFLQPHYQVCEKIHLGEMMMKGYGNNTSYWKQTNEIEHKAWIKQGEKDGKNQYSPEGVYLKLKLKASAGLDDEEDDEDVVNSDDKKGLIQLEAYNLIDGLADSVSCIDIKPSDIVIKSYDYEEFKKESELDSYSQIKLTKQGIVMEVVDNTSGNKRSAITIDKNGINMVGPVTYGGNTP